MEIQIYDFSIYIIQTISFKLFLFLLSCENAAASSSYDLIIAGLLQENNGKKIV